MHLLLRDQDSRRFGSLISSRFSKVFFNLSCLCLMGFPFTLGFYSKDSILSVLMFNGSRLLLFVFLVSCCFTVAYRVRLIFIGYFYFPSFGCFVSFLEGVNFFAPILFIFFVRIFRGNFYLIRFLSVSILSLIHI